MRRVLAAEAAELIELQPLRRLLLVLRRAVVPAFALGARQRDDVSHFVCRAAEAARYVRSPRRPP